LLKLYSVLNIVALGLLVYIYKAADEWYKCVCYECVLRMCITRWK
jgi:hypothetical protein